MELCRPSDSHLEHVNFECLFSCLSLRLLLRVFGSLLLERRVIFTADKLRSVPVYPTNLEYHQMSEQLNSDMRCKTNREEFAWAVWVRKQRQKRCRGQFVCSAGEVRVIHKVQTHYLD